MRSFLAQQTQRVAQKEATVVNYPTQQIEEVNQKYRSDGGGEERIAQYRKMGMLEGIDPGSWEETTVVCLMENQRLMREC